MSASQFVLLTMPHLLSKIRARCKSDARDRAEKEGTLEKFGDSCTCQTLHEVTRPIYRQNVSRSTEWEPIQVKRARFTSYPRPLHRVLSLRQEMTPSPFQRLIGLHLTRSCHTSYDMRNAVTIRLDQDLERMLHKFCRRSKRKRSDVVRDALRRLLSLMTFEQLRRKALPFAEARGFLTDQDVFKAVS